MAETAVIEDQLRASIIARPDVILQDPDVMRALVNADGQAQGANVIDLRSVAMDRLEQRLDRLESAHRSVLAAAYDNLSGTQQIQRAILRMLEPQDFEEFVQTLSGDVADMLRVDGMRLLLETEQTEDELSLTAMGDILSVAEPGFVRAYVTAGRDIPMPNVLLRQRRPEIDQIYGPRGADIQSEALLVLELGADKLPALLIMGSSDPDQFHPSHGTDLLGFFGGVFERAMRLWLA